MKKQTIILIILAILIVGAIYYFESTKVKPMQELGGDAAQSTEELTQPLLKEGKYPLAPELTGIVGYINAEEGLQLHNLRGKVVLVDFWTYSCINCIRTLPHLVAWDKQYRDQGLVIVGVHTPEFDFEKEIENVRMATEKYGIKYPIVQVIITQRGVLFATAIGRTNISLMLRDTFATTTSAKAAMKKQR